jgi:hypothetical protein
LLVHKVDANPAVHAVPPSSFVIVSDPNIQSVGLLETSIVREAGDDNIDLLPRFDRMLLIAGERWKIKQNSSIGYRPWCHNQSRRDRSGYVSDIDIGLVNGSYVLGASRQDPSRDVAKVGEMYLDPRGNLIHGTVGEIRPLLKL